MHIEYFTFNPFQERTCIVSDEAGFCAFVDPGCYGQEELSRITDFVNRQGLKPVCIMLTHAHFDHIYGMAALAKEYGIPVYAHRDEMFTIDTTNPQVCGAYGLELPETFPSRFEWAAEGEVIEVQDIPVPDRSAVELSYKIEDLKVQNALMKLFFFLLKLLLVVLC